MRGLVRDGELGSSVSQIYIVLSNLPCASMTRRPFANHEPIVKLPRINVVLCKIQFGLEADECKSHFMERQLFLIPFRTLRGANQSLGTKTYKG